MKRTRKDWILWAQLGCALVVTFHAEYTLALAAGVNEYVALAVPGALDLYVIRALQKHRDVLVAVLVMVIANVASHLVAAGIVPVGWAVYSAVGGTVPLLLWRGHALRQEPAGQGAVSAPAPVDECAASAVLSADECTYGAGCPKGKCASAADHAAWGPVPVPEYAPSARTPDRVPDEWAAEYEGPVPYLKPVPDLPPEYAASAVHSESPLTERDQPFLPGAQQYVDDTAEPSVRGLRRALGIGQDRAERLLTHLGVVW